MGLFSRREEISAVSPEHIAVAADLAATLPDPGEYLLTLLAPLHEDSRRALAAELDRVRHPNGSIPRVNLKGVGVQDWKSGPLTHFVLLTAKDTIILEVWASFGLSGQDKRRIAQTASVVAAGQGIPAAATWARNSRPNHRFDVEFLAAQLRGSWEESAGLIRNRDVIKSFTKWQRRG